MGGGERETPRALCGSLWALSAQRQSWHRELTLRHQAIPHRSIDQYEYSSPIGWRHRSSAGQIYGTIYFEHCKCNESYK